VLTSGNAAQFALWGRFGRTCIELRGVRRAVYRLRTLNLLTVWGHGRPGHSTEFACPSGTFAASTAPGEGCEPRQIRSHESCADRPGGPCRPSPLMLVKGSIADSSRACVQGLCPTVWWRCGRKWLPLSSRRSPSPTSPASRWRSCTRRTSATSSAASRQWRTTRSSTRSRSHPSQASGHSARSRRRAESQCRHPLGASGAISAMPSSTRPPEAFLTCSAKNLIKLLSRSLVG
jgi:hypothetical protein